MAKREPIEQRLVRRAELLSLANYPVAPELHEAAAELARLRSQLAEAEAERDRDCAEMRRFQAEWRKMLDDVTAADARLAASESKRKALVRECKAYRAHDKVEMHGDGVELLDCLIELDEARAATDATSAMEEPR